MVEQLERADEADAVAIVLRINWVVAAIASEVIRAKVDPSLLTVCLSSSLWVAPPHQAVTGLRQLQMRSGRAIDDYRQHWCLLGVSHL